MENITKIKELLYSRKGGRPSRVDWTSVVCKILESGRLWSAKEVHENLAESKVRWFRVYTLLRRAEVVGLLSRKRTGNRVLWGPPEVETSE